MSNPADRIAGEGFLQYYYTYSSLQLAGVSYGDVLAYYDNVSPPGGVSGGFVESLGYDFRNSDLSLDEFHTVLQKIANDNPGQIPDYRDFIPAITDYINGTAHTLQIVAQGTIQGLQQAAAVVTGGVAIYALAAGAIALFVLLRAK